METKYIFIDVDGTLVNINHQIMDSSIKAIQQARALGHKVFICTGRPVAYIYDDIKSIGFDGYINSAGGVVTVEDKVIYRLNLEKELLEHVLELLEKHKIGYTIESEKLVYTNQMSKYYYASAKKDNVYNSEMQRHIEMSEKELLMDHYQGEPVFKINLVGPSLQTLLNIQDQLKEEMDLVIFNQYQKDVEYYHCDLMSKKINKVSGIQAILDYYGASQEDTLAIGDGMNDAGMLQFCHVGISMKDGHPELKKMADFVTLGAEEDGIYEAFKKYKLLGEEDE